MRENHLWNRAKELRICTSPEIVGNFDIGFDDQISEETKDALIKFVYWVEDHFYLPVTLWVDFKYNHYLMDKNGKRVGYRFYWADFHDYPKFYNADDIPVIELPVRMEHSSIEEILSSFVEAITYYYLWLMNMITDNIKPDENEIAEVLRVYLSAE